MDRTDERRGSSWGNISHGIFCVADESTIPKMLPILKPGFLTRNTEQTVLIGLSSPKSNFPSIALVAGIFYKI
jgi:hypothetical protein